jgi:hypothetical protein
MNNTTRKRQYAVISDLRGGWIHSKHLTLDAALKSLAKCEKYAATGVVGLNPSTLLSVARWNGTRYVAMN